MRQFRISRLGKIAIAGLLAILSFPALRQDLLINAGFVNLLRSYPAFSERSRFEIAQVGVPRWRDNDVPYINMIPTLKDSQDMFSTAMAFDYSDWRAVHGQLRVAALSNTFNSELAEAAKEHGLRWELGAIMLNSEPNIAIDVWSDFCVEFQNCESVIHRLTKSAFYAEAIDLLRWLVTRSDTPLTKLEKYYSLALTTIPSPGRTHGDIVRNCLIFLSPTGAILPSHPILADIHALCAEGMIVDPYVDRESRLGTALAHAQLALDLAGATRYQLMIRGWASLTAGDLKTAQEYLRRAAESKTGEYQRGRSDEEMDILIHSLLLKASGARGN